MEVKLWTPSIMTSWHGNIATLLGFSNVILPSDKFEQLLYPDYNLIDCPIAIGKFQTRDSQLDNSSAFRQAIYEFLCRLNFQIVFHLFSESYSSIFWTHEYRVFIKRNFRVLWTLKSLFWISLITSLIYLSKWNINQTHYRALCNKK